MFMPLTESDSRLNAFRLLIWFKSLFGVVLGGELGNIIFSSKNFFPAPTPYLCKRRNGKS